MNTVTAHTQDTTLYHNSYFIQFYLEANFHITMYIYSTIEFNIIWDL